MYVADTDLICELRQKTPNPKVLQWLREHDHELLLTAITIGEIKKGVELYPDGRKKKELSEWLEGLLQDFDGSILEYSRDEALVWGALYAKAQIAGRKPPAFDSLNAAVAMRHGLTLVTRNEKDYAGTGVKVFNPWK
ncbi:MAG TPA: type II toxin-antitoxin system VapC family toxin [Verrucomicrobiae bacterium]|jgi:predicted nucleic acid-binding protein|nr:type II toxin-antitoxin system VapC family toxin [Verrucomicrobiae bacterium]